MQSSTCSLSPGAERSRALPQLVRPPAGFESRQRSVSMEPGERRADIRWPWFPTRPRRVPATQASQRAPATSGTHQRGASNRRDAGHVAHASHAGQRGHGPAPPRPELVGTWVDFRLRGHACRVRDEGSTEGQRPTGTSGIPRGPTRAVAGRRSSTGARNPPGNRRSRS